ncbi:MAG: stage 0 sporulation family protein [Clostridiales bacterium]|nr:stage 0 sporulation family protein [Clostridiales bacterium]
MPNVIGVRLRDSGRHHYVNPGSCGAKEGDAVIVSTSNGLEFAMVCEDTIDLPEDVLQKPLPHVLRLATASDYERIKSNADKEVQAFEVCKERIAAHKLDMKLVSVEYTFDNSKLIASFTSGGRVDFRALVKDLASIFKTRIELKQIGVRDEARKIGGVGSCGRHLCCSTFLYDFQPVSIRMAKEQSLSLNPTKISGVCGRLMCCLKYEQEQYEKSRKRLPRIGKDVITPQGRGTVTQVNALLETVTVRITNGEVTDLHSFTADQVQRIGQPTQRSQGKAKQDVAIELPDVSEQDEEFLGTPDFPDIDLCN